MQAVELSPGLIRTFGITALCSVVLNIVSTHAPMMKFNSELAQALVLAPENWWAQLAWHTKTPLALEMSASNRIDEAPVPELRRRLYSEGKSLPEVDALIERWTRENRDKDHSYEPLRLGRPQGVSEAKARALPEARRQRYQDSLDLSTAAWAALHEPTLTDPLCWEELGEKYRRAQKLGRRHGLEKNTGT